MREHFGDLVIDKLHERVRLMKMRLAERYSKTKPLRMEAKRIPEQEVDQWQMGK